ncbi:hypothetical protein [Allocoleopsis sp.]|uniref:hypothetical protein n=1 Tax=Allocoleopsis sp. TaxID=3088169 RepID=UPI002FD58392
MAESINTLEGREALDRIVRQARGQKTLRFFAKQVGVSHGVIARLEKTLTKNPPDTTLNAIAPFTEFNLQELRQILTSQTPPTVRCYRTAEEAWVIVKGLPPSEKALLGQMILAELGGLPNPADL